MSEWQLINTTILFPITIWPVNCIRRRTEVPPLELGCGLSIVTSFYDFTIPEVITLATSYLSMPCLVVESLRRFPQFDDVLRCQQRIDIFIFFFKLTKQTSVSPFGGTTPKTFTLELCTFLCVWLSIKGNFGVNQLLDGSISLSSLYSCQTNDLHVSIASVLHQDFSWLQPAQA